MLSHLAGESRYRPIVETARKGGARIGRDCVPLRAPIHLRRLANWSVCVCRPQSGSGTHGVRRAHKPQVWLLVWPLGAS